MKRVSAEELAKIIERHGKWLRGENGGEKADLSDTDLREAKLSGVRLDGANLNGAEW